MGEFSFGHGKLRYFEPSLTIKTTRKYGQNIKSLLLKDIAELLK